MCTAPPISTMQTWWTGSPFTSVGVYIGGAIPFCAEPNLTPSWVSDGDRAGMEAAPRLVRPTGSVLDPRADHTKLPTDPFWALLTGRHRGSRRCGPGGCRSGSHGSRPSTTTWRRTPGRRVHGGRAGVHRRLGVRVEPGAGTRRVSTAACARGSSIRSPGSRTSVVRAPGDLDRRMEQHAQHLRVRRPPMPPPGSPVE